MNDTSNTANCIKRKRFDDCKRDRGIIYSLLLQIELSSATFVEGHRGCLYEAENTIACFKKALELGCESVEFDVSTKNDKIF